ncbi:MAG: hypothetical protein LBR16_00120 [Treponema sp.]|jgi:polygalacturonase|nr:hypothetical protein [Treponema sp.]
MLNVKDYGAKGDGAAKDTAALQRAIDACAGAGGGTVLLEGGRFLCGTLRLRTGVELRVEASAVLAASPDLADYAADTHYNRYANETCMDRCFLYAEDARNIALTGRGLIDGNGAAFPRAADTPRPMLARFLRCRGVRVEALRLYDSPGWTTAFLDSEDIHALDLDIRNSLHYNGDCLDFDGCRDVFVSRCRMNGTDDNLCLQAGSKEHPMQNVHISDCVFTSVCAGLRIGLKSIGDIRDVVVTNCSFHDVRREGIKIECSEGGSISGLSFSNLVMRNTRRPLFILLNNRLERIGSSRGLRELPPVGRIERVRVSGLSAVDDAEEMAKTHLRFNRDIMGSPRFAGIRVDAPAEYPITQLTLRDLSYTALGGVKAAEIPQAYPQVLDARLPHEGRLAENYWPDWSRAACMDIRNVRGLRMEHLQFRTLLPDERPLSIIEGCSYCSCGS